MKLTGITAVLATMVSSQDFDFIDDRRFAAIGKFINATVTTSFDLPTLNKMIQNYGCHCFPNGSRSPGGHGEAQDGTDSLCRTLARCHACVELDHNGDFNSVTADCDPEGGYKYSVDSSTGALSCGLNTELCKMNACECDKKFAEDLGALWDDSAFDYGLWNNKNNALATLDYSTTCVKQSGNSNDECCGTYPERRPYSSLAHECCSDGSVAAIGSC